MNDSLIKEIENFTPINDQERMDKDIILDFLRNYSDIFYRTNLVAHITSSAWVTNKTHDKVLYAYHNLYNSWAWLGGHNDGEEDCLKVAIKEVKEESSIASVQPVFDHIFSLEILSVDSHYKRGQYVPTHLHLNITYLLEADDTLNITNKADENSAVGWFDLNEALSKPSEPWMINNIYSKLITKLKALD